jgi:quinol monooxygenase YgiN
MAAFNVVRFRVKSGRDEDFLEAHRRRKLEWQGMRRVTIIKTGERSYCLIGEWDSMEAMAAARPHMIKTLDTFRDTLEDLGAGLGITDPVSGEVVVELTG